MHLIEIGLAAALTLGMAGPCNAATLDTTPPVLAKFKAPKTLDVTQATNPLVVEIAGTDDLSGIESVQAFAEGPDLQTISVAYTATFQRTEMTGTMLSSNLPVTLPPGTYTFYMAVVRDTAGNASQYENAALAALGRTSFTVKNDRYDKVPPSIRGGGILTPEISLSSRHPGTDHEPTAGMFIDTYDGGNVAVAGTKKVQAQFCLLNTSTCIALTSYEPRPRVASSTAYLGAQMFGSRTLGEYQLRDVYMWDMADNYVRLTSTLFGGTTDFSQYFPTTTITLVP